jgi:hypothetical protein
MKRVLIAVATAAIVGGCAQQGVNTADGPYVEKEYRVGSNLPARKGGADPVTTISSEDLERARNSSLNPGAAMPPPRAGSH